MRHKVAAREATTPFKDPNVTDASPFPKRTRVASGKRREQQVHARTFLLSCSRRGESGEIRIWRRALLRWHGLT